MKCLILGGAGFIGTNVAEFYLTKGHDVTIFDNLSRDGSEKNAWYLVDKYPKVRLIVGDIREIGLLDQAVKDKDVIFHLAAQVAVTTSVTNPREDFDINAKGTLNVLEAVRQSGGDPIVIYSSTNKVYGNSFNEEETEIYGVGEDCQLDFHSPYGCSKGTADQYVRDYARIYGMKTVVFRQSCIYGPHQWGMADQGWIAWFMKAAMENKLITIYGDGYQIRDVLYVDDLVEAYDLAIKKIKKAKGEIFNIGGGSINAISIWGGFKPKLEKLLGKKIKPTFAKVRPGDQRIYISSFSKLEVTLGWFPRISIDEGLERLYSWMKEQV